MNVRRWLVGGTVALALGSALACPSERKHEEPTTPRDRCVTVSHHPGGVDATRCPR